MWPQKSCVPEGTLPVLAVPATVTCPCLTPMWRVMVSATPGCGERYWVWRTWDLLATWVGELRWPHRARQSPSPELIRLLPLACPGGGPWRVSASGSFQGKLRVSEQDFPLHKREAVRAQSSSSSLANVTERIPELLLTEAVCQARAASLIYATRLRPCCFLLSPHLSEWQRHPWDKFFMFLYEEWWSEFWTTIKPERIDFWDLE